MQPYPIFFFLVLFFVGLRSSAQKNVSELIGADSIIITPEGQHGVLKKLPFRSIRIIDSRFDTSKIGYVKRNTYKKITTEAALPQTLETSLHAAYGQSLDSASPHEALIVIKHLWLQETSIAEQEHRKMERSSQATQAFSNCTAVLEFYVATGDAYRPLFRTDTSFSEETILRRCAGRLLLEPFIYSVNKAAGMGILKSLESRRKLSWGDVTAFNAKRLQRTVVPGTPLQKGIYKTFADFIQNRAMPQEFRVEYGMHTDELFITTSGKDVLLTDYWGVCDGEKNYMRVGYGLFELAQQNNTYELWGSKLSVHKLVRRQPGSLSSGARSGLFVQNRMITEAKPLQLNMDTGLVY